MEIDKTFNPNIQCEFVNYSTDEVVKEYNDASIVIRSKVKTFCYCLDTLINYGITKTKEITLDGIDGGKKLCDDWVDKYFYSQSLMIGTFILVPMVNVILSILLRMLTEMERNKSESINASSMMWKSFLLQFINTVI